MTLPINAAASAKTATKPTTSVPAVAASTQVALPAVGNFAKVIDQLQDIVPLTYGSAPVFKAQSGGVIANSESNVRLGRFAKVSLLSWSNRMEVGPGNDSKEAKGYVAYSDDCVNITKVVGEDMQEHVGKSIAEYVAVLKNEYGMPKAAARRMIDMLVYVHESEKPTDFTGDQIILTLPPSSISSFDAYVAKLRNAALSASRGFAAKLPEDPTTFWVYVQSVSKDGKNWVKLDVSAARPSL